MVKAADALHDAGYDVTLLSTQGWIDWANEADEKSLARRAGTWKWKVVQWDKKHAPVTRAWTAVRFRVLRRIVGTINLGHVPLTVLGAAHVRVSREIEKLAARQSCDLFYGGGSALAATAVAATRCKVPFALDLEDFHSAELAQVAGRQVAQRIVEQIEGKVLSKAAFLTAGSAAIANAYMEKYRVTPVVINNTFPLPAIAPKISRGDGSSLKLYWFSQTIGQGRGLEDAVQAMGLASIPGELHLRGNGQPGYIDQLRRQAATAAPRLSIVHHPPAPADDMIALCAGYDVGLALEQPDVLNRDLCLTNKAFTYMLAGLAVAFTDTTAQRTLAQTMGEGAVLYRSGDVVTLASCLRAWAEDPAALTRSRQAAWDAGQTRWHWEHPEERGKLLDLVADALR